MAYKTIVEDNIDILVAGAGLGGTGAAFEARYWGQDKKIVIAEKANIDRSGAVAQGLYAINCYMGTRFGENNPEDHVRYARIDLMGMVREDLLFDMARHVDSAVHQFEEWGLPLMRNPKTGAYQREGRWQIMIHGESYKPIVAEAAKKSADKVFNRICVTHLLLDDAKDNRIDDEWLIRDQGAIVRQLGLDPKGYAAGLIEKEGGEEAFVRPLTPETDGPGP